jgi:hypothetical protein
MLWYAAQIQADDEEELKYHKSLAEYAATLVSAEGGDRVRQVIDAQQEGAESKVKQDSNFEDTLNTMFGRAPEFSQAQTRSNAEHKMELTDEDLDVVRVIRKKPTR